MLSSTSSHPNRSLPDASTEHPPRRLPATHPSAASELASLKIRLHQSLRQYPDFPSKGIVFEDILPWFADVDLHQSLLRALELHVTTHYGESPHSKPDVILGLEARGFLFGPSLALALGAGFVPVRKHGKLPGPTETAAYKKEYGEDWFQIQRDAIKEGQRVLVVDDIIATGMPFCSRLKTGWLLMEFSAGGSAAAAGSLVKASGGILLGYVFLLELDFLQGRTKLDAPVHTLLVSQEREPSAS